jgi:hypothetical protein
MKIDIPLVGDILLLVGLGLATVGGVLLAYDAIHGAGARFQAQVAATQLKTLKTFRAGNREIFRNLKGSYTEEEKQALLDDEEKRYGSEEDRLARIAGSIEDIYAGKVEVLAVRGIILLIAAFVFQFSGTLMVALGSGPAHL